MISVVIPTYNRPVTLIERAIPSVLAQTVTDWELIVVGDGTDDETVRRMTAMTSERIRFVNLPHAAYPEDRMAAWCISGVVAVNHGWDLATGEWLWRLDDDDELLPKAFETLLEAQARTGADVVYGVSEWWGETGSRGWYQGKLPPGPGTIADGANLRRTDLPYRYSTNPAPMAADSELWTRMAANGVRFHLEPVVIHRYWHWRQGFGG